jgi:hypothetical protein
MTTTTTFFAQPLRMLILSFALLAFVIPSAGHAATSPVGSFDEAKLTTTSKKPTLTGEATGTKKVIVTFSKEGSTKVYYKKTAPVTKSGNWKAKIGKSLPKGEYEVKLYAEKVSSSKLLDTETFTVESKSKKSSSATKTSSKSTLAVNSIPLLFGGNAKLGASVPVSYLQLTNTGSESVTLKGFWMKQNGSAPDKAVIGLTTVDDKGGSRGATAAVEGSSPFKNGVAFVPTAETTIAPGEIKLFTIKAVLSTAATNVGKQLMLDVTGVEATSNLKASFPIRGTTYTVAF